MIRAAGRLAHAIRPLQSGDVNVFAVVLRGAGSAGSQSVRVKGSFAIPDGLLYDGLRRWLASGVAPDPAAGGGSAMKPPVRPAWTGRPGSKTVAPASGRLLDHRQAAA